MSAVQAPSAVSRDPTKKQRVIQPLVFTSFEQSSVDAQTLTETDLDNSLNDIPSRASFHMTGASEGSQEMLLVVWINLSK